MFWTICKFIIIIIGDGLVPILYFLANHHFRTKMLFCLRATITSFIFYLSRLPLSPRQMVIEKILISGKPYRRLSWKPCIKVRVQQLSLVLFWSHFVKHIFTFSSKPDLPSHARLQWHSLRSWSVLKNTTHCCVQMLSWFSRIRADRYRLPLYLSKFLIRGKLTFSYFLFDDFFIISVFFLAKKLLKSRGDPLLV